jgi:hypothetical protein
MMTYSTRIAAVALLVLLCGCNRNGLDEGRIVQVAKDRPFNLESEEVTLTAAELGCGVENELWEAPVELSDRSVARLTQKARDLNFTDDITFNEAGYSQPHAQMRGSVSIDITQVLSISDGAEQGTKIVQAQTGVVVNHPCFPAPLPIMAIKRSKYVQGLPPMIEFDYTDQGWRLAKIIH